MLAVPRSYAPRIAALGALLGALLGEGCAVLFPTSSLSSDTGDDGPAEAGADGPIQPDAMEAALADAASPCSAAHAFCDDFERATAPATGWFDTGISAGGSVDLVTTRARSGQRSLASVVPRRAAAGAIPAAYLVQAGPELTSKVEVAFDVFVEKPAFAGGDQNVGLACIAVFHDGVKDVACVGMGPEEVTFGARSPGAIAFDEWVHVEIVLARGAAPVLRLGERTITGSYDSPKPEPATAKVQLNLGLVSFNAPAPGVAATFDNVTIDAR